MDENNDNIEEINLNSNGEEIKEEVKENSEETLPEQDEFEKEDSPRDTKKLLILIGIIVVCFSIFFILKIRTDPTGAATTIDELHQLNIQGKMSENNYLYNGFSFVKLNGLWYTQVFNRETNTQLDIPLHFGPKEIENIPMKGRVDGSFNRKEMYITFNPLSDNMQHIALASAELSLNLVKGFGITPIAACDRNKTEACSDRPIVDCHSPGKAVIYLRQAENISGIILDGNCATIVGNEMNLVKSVDKFLLKLYGVME